MSTMSPSATNRFRRGSLGRARWCAVFVLSLAAAVGVGAGPVLAAQAGSTASSGSQGAALDLALADAIRIAFENNLDIRVVGFDRSIAEERVLAARGAFDPVFSLGQPGILPSAPPSTGGFGPVGGVGGLGLSDVQEPSSSVLSGADVFDSNGFVVALGVRHRLPFGMTYGVDYNIDRSESNSIFQSLNPAWNNRLTIGVAQPLLRGAGRKAAAATLLLAQEGTGAAAAAFRARVEQLLLSVERAYWELVFAERDLEVKDESLGLAREQLGRTQAQVDVGLIAPVQATQAEVAVASRETELILARNALEGARDELRALLRAESLPAGWETELRLVDEPRVGGVEVDVQALSAMAVERRAEIEQLSAALRARGVEVDAARNSLLPSVDLVAQVSFNGIGGDELVRPFFGGPVTEVVEGGYGDAASQLFSFDFPAWRLGVSVAYPLGNRTARGNYAEATLDQDRARTELERLEQQVTLEVRLAARRLVAATDAVGTTTKTRQLAERQLEIEQDRFEVGMTTNFEVLEFQEQLAQARSSELRAVIEQRLAEAELERATGGLLDRFGIEIR